MHIWSQHYSGASAGRFHWKIPLMETQTSGDALLVASQRFTCEHSGVTWDPWHGSAAKPSPRRTKVPFTGTEGYMVKAPRTGGLEKANGSAVFKNLQDMAPKHPETLLCSCRELPVTQPFDGWQPVDPYVSHCRKKHEVQTQKATLQSKSPWST